MTLWVLVCQPLSLDNMALGYKLYEKNLDDETRERVKRTLTVTTRVSCPMDFSAYPFDNQVCYFKMESYQFTAKQVSYNWFDPKIGRSPQIQLGQFDFDFYSVQQQNTSHQNRSYPTVMIELVLRRRIVYHLMNTFLPSGLFVMVSWLTLLVPHHQMPARMVLTITTLLTLVSMFAGVRQETPKVSYAKAVDQWMIMCVIFVFCVLFEFTVVIFLHERGKRTSKSSATPQLVQERRNLYNPTNRGRNTATSFTNHASFFLRHKNATITPAESDSGDRPQGEGQEYGLVIRSEYKSFVNEISVINTFTHDYIMISDIPFASWTEFAVAYVEKNVNKMNSSSVRSGSSVIAKKKRGWLLPAGSGAKPEAQKTDMNYNITVCDEVTISKKYQRRIKPYNQKSTHDKIKQK
ncbi:gamma-aminobutyric acid receptor subunit beta-like [Penaeus indicus]|uniref:gamma-aminobutyric acid receptor subunit beta-like n=1 Tax=Penaeus indicus TaxID=29960 RepID=UPI00300D9B47